MLKSLYPVRLATTNALTMSDFIRGLPDDLFQCAPDVVAALSADLRAILKRVAFFEVTSCLLPPGVIAAHKQRVHGAVANSMAAHFSGVNAIP